MRFKSQAFVLLVFALSFGKIIATPNFVFIIADDCTFRDIGCYGGQAKTPNIDRLANEGMRFTRCFQAAPMCSPTRHNLYTGIYPVKSGAYPNHTFVKDGIKSVVHYLKPKGYRVALSGKTHINPRTSFPFEYSTKGNNPDLDKIDQLFEDSVKEKTPFCLFACSNEPHSPWDKGNQSDYDPQKIKLPPYFVDTPETREAYCKYLAEIGYYDWQVGQILKKLDKHGLQEDTMVVVVSEQGSGFPFAKWTCYENGLQSAMVVRWPGKIKAGSKTSAMVEYVDVLPTFLDAAKFNIPKVLEGQSFLPVLLGNKHAHKKYVYGLMTTKGINNGSENYGIRSVRDERYKYIWNFTPDVEFQNACTQSMVFKSWIKRAQSGDADAKDKVNRYQWRPEIEIYDLEKDPYEWNNLAGKSEVKTIQQRLSNALKKWMKSQGDLGQETEMAALERQRRGKKKSANKKNNKS
ncbi:MAG: sulfatase [Verrucomicrobiota bacterium]|nr:sulfatase [Verrucomicrobiota bacterium]